MEVFIKFFELVRTPYRYIFGAFVTNILFLFAPDRYLAALGVLKYRQTEKPYFGLLFFLLLTITIAAIFDAAVNTARYYNAMRAARKRLHSLTLEEKAILAGYIARDTRAQYLSIQSGVVRGLVHAGIIYRSSPVSSPEFSSGIAFAHNIQEWAWEYLKAHIELLLPEDDRASEKAG